MYSLSHNGAFLFTCEQVWYTAVVNAIPQYVSASAGCDGPKISSTLSAIVRICRVDILICKDNKIRKIKLKKYYEIVNIARPLSVFFSPQMLIFYRNAFLIMKLSNLPSFRAIWALKSNCFTIGVWKTNCCLQQFIFLLSYCYLVSHFTQVL